MYLLIIAVFGVFLTRLVFIWSDKELFTLALENKTVVYVSGGSAPRGRILDTNGKVLVDNLGVKTIYYNKIKGISTSEEIEIAKKLAGILSVDEGSILEQKEFWLVNNNNGSNLITEEEYKLLDERKLSSSDLYDLKIERITEDMLNEEDELFRKCAKIYSLMNDGYVYSKKEILKRVSDEEYAKVIESNIPGVTGELSWERIYLYGDTLRNILGSVSSIPSEEVDEYLSNGYELTDIVGISYLEKEYEEYLKGEKAKYLVNSDNTLTLVEEEQRGNDLVLSIDIDIQMKAEEIIKDKILLGKKYPNTDYYKDSYALVSNPLTGEIIAMAGIRLNSDDTWSDISLNTINKSFTIGSAVKGATIAVGYQNNLIEMGKYITDSCVKLYLTPQKCSFKSLGRINDLTALAYSSNYYQFMIAIALTGNTYTPNMKLNATEEHFKIYRDMLASFGLGAITNIDLPGETTGIIGSTVADDLLLNLAIGQYDTYTPIEVLQYINSMASGTRMSLSLMKEIRNDDEVVVKNEIEVLNDVAVDEEYLNRIREGLTLVLKEGTGKIYVRDDLLAAGKTGTSESFYDSDNDGKVDVQTITSTFAGYFPNEDPKYSVVVITPNISHNNGTNDTMYYGASKITKELTSFLADNY
ncbi:MAG TPA: penicillin-binding protein 2 [Candidatus Onthocola stercorigallinarum]|nr:penicillin-binding protein 2 [Candidatus Onthocola stercorigallinarum]